MGRFQDHLRQPAVVEDRLMANRAAVVEQRLTANRAAVLEERLTGLLLWRRG